MIFSALLIDDVSGRFVFTFVMIAPLGYAVHDTAYSPYRAYIAQQSYLSSCIIINLYVFYKDFKNALTSFPNNNKSRMSSVRELHR
jgi:hypothetical protein